MTGSRASSDVLPQELEALLAELLGDAQPARLVERADRLESALGAPGALPARALDELRSALDLVRGGQTCAAVSALLAARSAMGAGSA